MDEARFELVRAKRDMIRQLYGNLFDRVSGILFRHDPVGIKFGTNTDEYEAEAGTILPRLEDVRSEEEALDAIYEEFVECRSRHRRPPGQL